MLHEQLKEHGTNLSKDVKHLHNKNYKTFRKEIDDTHRTNGKSVMFVEWKNKQQENVHIT